MPDININVSGTITIACPDIAGLLSSLSPAPAPAPTPTFQAPPVAPPTNTPPAYTLDQIATAGANLIGSNSAKMGEVMALCAQFGVQTADQLKPEQYGAFATALRGLGAQI